MQNSTDKSAGAATHWDDLRYFLVLAEQGSLSAAARVLAVEHSTVSRRLGALEQSLGVRLFDRLPRGWQLTAEGRELLTQAERVDYEMQAFARAAAGLGQMRGTVRVSAPPLLVSHFLLPLWSAPAWPPAERPPVIDFDLELLAETHEASLARNEADIALRVGQPDAPGLVSRTLATIGYGLYGTAPWVSQPSETWRILGLDDSYPGGVLKQWLAGWIGDRRCIFRSNDLLALHKAAENGWGVALLPHFLAGGSLALRRLPAAVPLPERPLCLVMHPDVRRSPRVRRVADLLVELIRQQAGQLASGAAAD